MNKPAAGVWLVSVKVCYTCARYDPQYRLFACRIVAFNSAAAELGAMRWAETRPPFLGADPGPGGYNAMAMEAFTVDQICPIDCIAESVVHGQ